MKLKTLINALDTIVDKVEIYGGDWNYMFSIRPWDAEKATNRVRKFRVYETEKQVVLMVLV